MTRGNRGLSILSLLIVTAIGGATVVGLIEIYQLSQAAVLRAGLNNQNSLLINQIFVTINDPAAWTHTLDDTVNSNLECLRTGGPPCDPTSGGKFNLRDRDDQVIINSLSQTAGFDRSGQPCADYSPTGTSTCVTRAEVSWQPVNITGADPQIRIDMSFQNGQRSTVRSIYKNLPPQTTGGLVLHLKFDGPNGQPLPAGAAQIMDSSGSGNHGTLVNNKDSATFVTSPQGTGLHRTLTSWVEVPDSPSLKITGPLTIAAWIRVNPAPGPGDRISLFGKRNVATWDSYVMRIENEALVVCVGETTATLCTQFDFPFQALTWYHVVGVWTGTRVFGFINGTANLSALAFAGPVIYSNDPITVGVENQNGTFTPGSGELDIDEVRVWSRALTPAEIMSQYQAEKP